MLNKCRLCQRESELRHSHIVPEFLYSELYNSKQQMMGINDRGSRGWAALQIGIREHLFCEPCEQHFNECFEKSFHLAWVKNYPLPRLWKTEQLEKIRVDYTPFKLFHLSVLFRASVSSLPTFAEVSLGPHEEWLREMLIRQDAGPADRYPIFGHAVIHHRTGQTVPMVSKFRAGKFGGRRCYGVMYGGAQWWIGVASDTNLELQQVALKSDGTMQFMSVPWHEVTVVQQASAALRNAGK